MKLFLKIIYSNWCDLKIWIHLNFMYPYNPKFAKIRSILPIDLKVGNGVVIGKNVIMLKYLREIGKNVYIGGNTYIGLCNKIGNFTSISFDVKIGLRNHPIDHISTSPAFYGRERGWVQEDHFVKKNDTMVEIGSDVLISSNVLILQGVKIGHGAIIAAGAVVNRDVEPYSIVGGVPAKLIRYRFDEALRSRILQSKWWEQPDSLLKELVYCADKPDDFLNQINK